jgi:ribonucleoside-diphosphate reductase alpha chain
MSNISLGEKFLQNTNIANLSKEELIEVIGNFYSDDEQHAQRIKTYMHNQWFWVSTPISANIPINGMAYRGSPIACFLSEVNRNNLAFKIYETSEISSIGGGLGMKLTNITSYDKNDLCRNGYGALPYVKQFGEIMRLMSGYARQAGSVALWIDVNNADIIEFINMRKNHQGIDPSLHIPRFIHHGIVISDEFMNAVIENKQFALVNANGDTIKMVNARSLFTSIIQTRMETGEPYILFESNANRALAQQHKNMNLSVKLSNLCTEILLPTGKDPFGHERTSICCLSSINLEKYFEWNGDNQFIEDLTRFMDNVITYFIVEAGRKKVGEIVNYEHKYGLCKVLAKEEQSAVEWAIKSNHPLKHAIYSAWRSRDLGIGICGLSSLFQSLCIPMDSNTAKDLNKTIFDYLKKQFDEASYKLALEKGSCPDAEMYGIIERCSYKTAIAPTAMLSSILGVSKGIEPDYPIYLSKTQAGTNLIKNKYLTNYLESIGKNNQEMWCNIADQGTSILNQDIHEIFKRPFEISQSTLLELASDRNIDQSQSLNLFYQRNVDINIVIKEHIKAWRLGIKTLYYLFSESQIKASDGLKLSPELWKSTDQTAVKPLNFNAEMVNDQICVSCQ